MSGSGHVYVLPVEIGARFFSVERVQRYTHTRAARVPQRPFWRVCERVMSMKKADDVLSRWGTTAFESRTDAAITAYMLNEREGESWETSQLRS